MDYELLKIIQKKLNENGYSKISEDLSKIVRSGSTGGEITSMVGKYLYDLKNRNHKLNDLIGSEIDSFINYSYDQGLRIKKQESLINRIINFFR